MSHIELQQEQILSRVLSSLPVERALTLRSVNRKWKELIENTYWDSISEKIEHFKVIWLAALEKAKVDVETLVKLIEEHLEKEPSKDLEKIVKHIKENQPNPKLFKLFDYFNTKTDSMSWKEKVENLKKFRSKIDEIMTDFDKNEEYNLCCYNPFQIGDNKPKHLLALPGTLKEVINYFEQGTNPYVFPK